MNYPLLFALACSAALSASAGTAYLVVIGPAPLRFEGRPRPVPRALALLPPLPMHDPLPVAPPTNAVTQTTVTNLPAATVVVSPPVPAPGQANPAGIPATNPPPLVVLPGPLPPPTGPLLGPWLDPNDPQSLLTAQMLIHYFRPQGTNAPGPTVATPLFIPPRPAGSFPSSTVRYSTP